MRKNSLITTLIVVAVLILIGGYALLKKPIPAMQPDVVKTGLSDLEKSEKYMQAPEISGATGFINTDKISLSELKGDKVVLVDFWTYSCINCQRTTPYLNAWYKKYHDQGLEIIGVHSPEFEFEKDINNVRKAVEKYGIKYPVVLDNNFETWRAYGNQYWPRKYLVDVDGYIVYDHIGEGDYEETERVIKQLLEERQRKLGTNVSIDKSIVSPEGAESVERGMRYTPEIYFGAERNDGTLGNGVANNIGQQTLVIPEELNDNMVYHDGKWVFEREFASNSSKRAKIILPYQAAKVFMVASADKPIKVKVLVDGKVVNENAGSDVVDGYVTIDNEDLYRLVDDPEGWGKHTIELIIEGVGLKAFTFTFG